MNTYISLYFNVIYVFIFDCFRVLVYGVFHFGNSHSLNDRSRAKCLQSPFLILRFFFVRLILSMSGGRNAVKCKANTKYGRFALCSYSLSLTSSTVPHFGQVIVFVGCGANSSGTETPNTFATFSSVPIVGFPLRDARSAISVTPNFSANSLCITPFSLSNSLILNSITFNVCLLVCYKGSKIMFIICFVVKK